MVRKTHWSLRYGIAAAAIIWSTASLLLVPTIGRSGVTIPFFAVFLSAWFGGLGPGVFTIVVGVLLYLVVLFQRGSAFPPWQIITIALFVAGGAMIAALVEVLHAARRRAEANERWLAAVLSSIGDAVIATDGGGRVAFINPVARSLTGWGEVESRGKPLEKVFTIVSEDDSRPVENPVVRVIRDGIVVGLANHTSLIARNGTERRSPTSVDQGPRRRDHRGGPGLPGYDRGAAKPAGAGRPARRRTGRPLGGRVRQSGQGPLHRRAQPRAADPRFLLPFHVVTPRTGRRGPRARHPLGPGDDQAECRARVAPDRRPPGRLAHRPRPARAGPGDGRRPPGDPRLRGDLPRRDLRGGARRRARARRRRPSRRGRPRAADAGRLEPGAQRALHPGGGRLTISARATRPPRTTNEAPGRTAPWRPIA